MLNHRQEHFINQLMNFGDRQSGQCLTRHPQTDLGILIYPTIAKRESRGGGGAGIRTLLKIAKI